MLRDLSGPVICHETKTEMSVGQLVVEEKKCFHCDDLCKQDHTKYDEKDFCCPGCKAVYKLFQENDLEDFYAQRNTDIILTQYDFLDNSEIGDHLISYSSEHHNQILLNLPDVHCSSCIYLVENLHKLDPGIIKISLNFLRKEANVHYDPTLLSLKSLALLLASVGYPPQFELDKKERNKRRRSSNQLSIKIGVAAFCFGNIMLLSFPEYLGIDDASRFEKFFGRLNILLAIPVGVYAANDYFISAWKGLKNRFINIDVPIALGVFTLFFRSTYEVMQEVGPGYFDSMAGLVFFLLIGRWFQSKTYENLSFERDYKSYFPLAVLKNDGDDEVSIPIKDIVPDDVIIIRNNEIIPADAVLLTESANIDYSFVTGENQPIEKRSGDLIYAGGRQIGNRIKLKAVKRSSQSYLTSLWNNHRVFKDKDQSKTDMLINRVGKYFTIVVLGVGLIAAIYWMFTDPAQSWEVFTAVLIVACPCALALSAPFVNGNSIRVFGRNRFYLKHADVAERITTVDTIVLDKTGTLTLAGKGILEFEGEALSVREKSYIRTLTSNSTHPLSKRIHTFLSNYKDPNIEVENYQEIAGKGLVGICNGQEVRLGSAKWIGATLSVAGRVYVSISGSIKGYFEFHNQYRKGVKQLLKELAKRYDLKVLSGDNDHEKEWLSRLFPSGTEMYFDQTPDDKLRFVLNLQQEQNRKVMMLGDGLNDAGALKQSNIGIAVTENVSSFSPACDGIIEGDQLAGFSNFLDYAIGAKGIIIASFIISILYNLIGLGFAVSGALTPIFAAILMPVSSISVVLFTTISGNILAGIKKI